MNKQIIQDEFKLRYYHWAMMDFEREIHHGFPLLKRVKGLASFRLLKIMESLQPEEQIKYASILVRRCHKRAVELTKDQLTKQEEKVWQKKSKLMIDSSIFSCQDHYPKTSGSKTMTRNLRGYVQRELEPVMGNLYESERNLLGYKVNLGAHWDIYTSVYVGGKNKLEYFHLIRAVNQHDFHLGPLAGIDLLRWFGVAGTAWDLLEEEEAEYAANSLAIICSHFIHAAPILIEDLIPN